MKIKKYLFGLILFMTFFLAGCEILETDTSKTDSNAEFAKIYNNLQTFDSIDMVYTTTVEIGGTTISVDSKMVVLTEGDQTKFYLQTGEGTNSLKIYYIDEYLYTETFYGYEIIETSEFDYESENPLPIDLDLDEFEYEVNEKEVDGKIIYTINTSGEELIQYIEDLYEDSIGEMDIEMMLELTVVKGSNKLESIKTSFTVTEGEDIFRVEVLATIQNVGIDVDFTIPYEVKERIDDYIMEHSNNNPNPNPEPEPEPEPEPDPAPTHYDNTTDGVVTYHDLGLFEQIVYDQETNQLIVRRSNKIDIYDADTLALNRTIRSLLTPHRIDADNGKLVVSYFANYFNVYDLKTDDDPLTIQTSIVVNEIVIDNDVVIYADYDQWCTIVFHYLSSNQVISKRSYYRPRLTLNRNDHILYVTETGISSADLIYFNSQTGEELYRSGFTDFRYVSDRIRFDGKFIHHEGRTFNRFNGLNVSSALLNRHYPSYAGFTPQETLFDTDKIAFVASITSQYKVGIYNNNDESFVYEFSLYTDTITPLKNSQFLAVSKDQQHIAIVNINQIDEDLVPNLPVEQSKDTVTASEDGKMKSLRTDSYTHSVVDGDYIYTISEYNFTLNVYSVHTLEKVYSERFLMKPITMDAFDGRLVIGFGDAKQFRIYDATTWEFETIPTSIPVYSVVIYKDTIIFSEVDQHCYVQIYDMKEREFSNFGYSGYYLTMAINREDGIIYFGDRRSSASDLTYYNLEDRTQIFSWDFSYNYTNVRFDGNFVHFANETFDKLNGIKISNSDLARFYEDSNIESKATIFDNDSISIYTGIQFGEPITVVYDLNTDKALYTIKGNATHAYLVEDTIVLLNNSTEYILTLNLSEL